MSQLSLKKIAHLVHKLKTAESVLDMVATPEEANQQKQMMPEELPAELMDDIYSDFDQEADNYGLFSEDSPEFLRMFNGGKEGSEKSLSPMDEYAIGYAKIGQALIDAEFPKMIYTVVDGDPFYKKGSTERSLSRTNALLQELVKTGKASYVIKKMKKSKNIKKKKTAALLESAHRPYVVTLLMELVKA
jgi:hypothetical protein